MKKLFNKMVKFSMTTAIAGTLAVVGAGFIGTPAGMFADTFIPSTVSAMTQDEQGVYLISTPDDLIEFLYVVSDAKSGKFTKDIVFQDGYTHAKVNGLHHTQYSMTLDGQNHKLVNYNINNNDESMRCFGDLNNSLVKNLTIDVGTIQLDEDYDNWGAFTRETKCSDFVNCTAMGDIYFNGKNEKVAGFVGYACETRFVNCTNRINFHSTHEIVDGVDTLPSVGNVVGGIAASVSDDGKYLPANYSQFYNCKNYGNIEGIANVGGIAGFARGKSSTDFEKCENYGEVKCYDSYLGGIIGHSRDSNIKDCVNYANITKIIDTKYSYSYAEVGGIVGMIQTPFAETKRTISGCTNYGTINGGNGLENGGIIGDLYVCPGSEMSTTDCINYGSVMSDNNEVGGIIGYLLVEKDDEYGPGNAKFTDNVNNGDVTAANDAGGLIGRYKGNANQLHAERCYNSGKVAASEEEANVGGLVGRSESDISESFVDCSGEHKHDYKLISEVKATTDKEGSALYACWCGSEETRVLPKLEKPANDTGNNKPGNKPGTTTDNNNKPGTNANNPNGNTENGNVAIAGKTPVRGAISSVKNSKKKTAVVTIKVTKYASKYQIQIASKKNFTKAKKQVAKNKKLKKAGKKTKYAFYKTKTVTLKDASKKTIKTSFKKLTKGKTYYVRVRGVNGDKTGKWSKAKKVIIRK